MWQASLTFHFGTRAAKRLGDAHEWGQTGRDTQIDQHCARILAEIGDDRARFATAGGLRAYADAAPITRASGKRHYAGRRFVKNNRLNHGGHLWAFASLGGSADVDAHYRRRRTTGDWHMQALRHLLNRMLGQLHHCFLAQVLFDEAMAFPTEPQPAGTATA